VLLAPRGVIFGEDGKIGMRKVLGLVSIAALMAVGLAFAGSASAADDLVIEAGGSVRGTPGDTITVAEQATPEDLVGQTCLATLNIDNNGSIHLGNNLTVTTAGNSYVFENFESSSGQSTIGSGEIEIGDTVLVELTFGDGGRSCGSFVITFDCEEPPPETTTTEPVPTSVSPETTVPDTTTTVPTDVQPQTTQRTEPEPTVPPAQPETPTAAAPSYTG
jgi:hypothetical protein